ncbi:MAG: hypothetical protein ACRCZS_20795 [Chroococcidiopsis sp.]
MTRPERIVDTTTGVLLMLTTGFSVLVVGAVVALFSSSYESNCAPNESGKSVCTTNVKFGGWGAIPLQGIAGLASTSLTCYFAIKNGKAPKVNTEEGESDLPS